jgi:RNA polymerase primary sigma factor
MYLREMGSVELLSREGEIAIAKRIEAGRDTMIRGLCESALTFEAIMVWREELGTGRILLREVIDLEQTYGGVNARPPSWPPKRPTPAEEEESAEVTADRSHRQGRRRRRRRLRRRRRPDHQRHGRRAARRRHGDPGRHRLEFDSNFRKLQEKLVGKRLKGEDLSDADRKAYETASLAIVQHLKTLKLNNNRIEALVEQLYAINKRLMGLEGRLLRLADSYGISRGEFLKAYFGQELNPNWGDQVKTLGVRWTKFVENDASR